MWYALPGGLQPRACILRAFILSLSLAAAAPASAEIVYQPINPSFGGNPFNSSHLLGILFRSH